MGQQCGQLFAAASAQDGALVELDALLGPMPTCLLQQSR